MLPTPPHGRIPAIVTGRSRQDLEWIARHADGWLYYFVNPEPLAPIVSTWRDVVQRETQSGIFKPFAQGLFFDLADDANHPLMRIHSGLRVGRNRLIDYLGGLQQLGVNHVAFNLKASRRPATEVLQELAEFVLPAFPSNLIINSDRPVQ